MTRIYIFRDIRVKLVMFVLCCKHMQVRRKENETTGSFLYRFTKKVRQSGILREAKKRRFHKRSPNLNKRKQAAMYREVKRKEVEKAKKMGLL